MIFQDTCVMSKQVVMFPFLKPRKENESEKEQRRVAAAPSQGSGRTARREPAGSLHQRAACREPIAVDEDAPGLRSTHTHTHTHKAHVHNAHRYTCTHAHIHAHMCTHISYTCA